MEDMAELVSVLIPAYNAERWISTTIRSATSQTWPNVEVIVVDDGSRDTTLAVARRWESKSVRVVTQPNMGACAARNGALALAQGTYIQWLDADDLLAPGKIAAQMAVAQKLADRRVLLSCPFGTFYHRPEKALFEETPLWRDLQPLEYFLTRFNNNACFQTDAWLVSRELTEANGLWTDFGSPDDDGEYFCRMMMNSAGVKFVADARSYYRVGNAGSLANTRSAEAVAALFKSKEKCIRYLLSMEDSARTREASLHLLQTWMLDLFGHDAVIGDAMRLAAELGGTLYRPVLKWKYKPIEWLFGYEAAFKARRILPKVRALTESSLDQFLFGLSRAGAGSGSIRSAPGSSGTSREQ
jgi:glycosyltransferase involved in cell wall biosynthesis